MEIVIAILLSVSMQVTIIMLVLLTAKYYSSHKDVCWKTTLTVICWMGYERCQKAHYTSYSVDTTVIKIHELIAQMRFHTTNEPCIFYCSLMHPNVKVFVIPLVVVVIIIVVVENKTRQGIVSPSHWFHNTLHKSFSEWASNHYKVQH